MHKVLQAIFLLSASLLIIGCTAGSRQKSGDIVYTEDQIDSLTFYATHHYTDNYNFVVKSDSIILVSQQPEEYLGHLAVDTFVVRRNEHLVVADIRIIPADSIDSVWVQVARDQFTFGWTRESALLPNVVPDDPISQFISAFSDKHLLCFIVIILGIGIAYLMRHLLKKQAKIVHFNDIDSFYPTLLALLVASSATLYSSIQLFASDSWQHFYYHPTLNPFTTPLLLSIFITSVWAILIVAIAAIDDARKLLPIGEALLYLCGLAAVCAINYIVFSLTTLIYIGYLLLIAYLVFAFRRYFKRSRNHYICGNCGAKLHSKGRCPQCGVINE